MAITAETRQDIMELVVTAFNAAPGTTLLSELVAIADEGSIADVAAFLTAHAEWTKRYPSFQTAEEFAEEWLGNLIPEADADTMAEAEATVVGLVNGGSSFAEIILAAQDFLSSASEDDASFGTSVANFSNKVEAATTHTITNESAGLSTDVLASVTSDDSTVTAATAPSTAGSAYKLTTGVDTITGTANDDTISAIYTTFNSLDTIDGGDGNDTLVLTDAGTKAWTVSTGATVKNVETVRITNTNGEASGAVSAVTEKANVTFGPVSNGKTVIIAGLTMTAGADLTGAEVAAAFSTGATAGNAVITGTLSGYTVSAGPDSNTTTFTSSTAGNVADLVNTGTVNTAVEKVTTYTLTNNSGVDGEQISVTVNGTKLIGVAADVSDVDAQATVLAGLINTFLGKTVATASSDNSGVLTVQSNAIIGTPQNEAALSKLQVATALSSAAYAAETPTISITQGVASAAGSYAGDTVTASKFTGATSFVNDLSDSKVTISSIPSTAELTIVGNGVSTNGATVASFSKTASPVVNITGGITGSPDLTLTGTSTTAATIKSSGAPLTSTGKIGTNGFGTVSLFADAVSTTGTLTLEADSNLSMKALTTDAATIVATGAGSVSISSSGVSQAITDANLKTVDASALEGGLTFAMSTSLLSVKGGQGNDSIKTAAVSALASIDAGDGVDTLTIGTATDIDTAKEGAQYKNFETLVAAAGSYDASLVSGIQAVVMQGAGTLSNMNATQAGNVTIAASGQYSMALAASAGTSDVLSMTLGYPIASTSAATSVTTRLTANGFETINLKARAGSLATAANQKSTVAAFTADKVKAINLTGSSFILSDIATTKAVTIDGTALTGDKATTDPVGFTTAGNPTNGSHIKGSAYNDTFTIGTEGSTYDGNDGDDTFTILSADPEGTLSPDGTTDLKINGGSDTASLTAGQDILEIKSSTITDDTTLTDTHFTFVTGMEQLKLSNTGDHVLTVGGSFNSAFADGATIKTGTLAATKDMVLNGGLASVPIKLTVDATSLTGAATDDIIITTGTADDKVTITGDATWVGATNADGGQITISTKAGDDTISVTIGTLTTQTTTQAITITGGTGADTITKVGVNGTVATTVAVFSTPYTDSPISGRDKITGFDTAVNATSLLSDKIDFTGTAAVSSFSNSADFGVIASHSITAGLATFDDATNFATALIINESNLSDVLGYLAANTATNDVVLFHYDSNNDGANDGSMVFHNYTSTADSLVELVGVMPAAVTTTATSTTDNIMVVA